MALSVVHKYAIDQVTVLDLPPDSQVVRVGMDRSRPCIWLQHYAEWNQRLVKRTFHIFVTGESFDNIDFRHVGSFAAQSGQFIGHVYELIS